MTWRPRGWQLIILLLWGAALTRTSAGLSAQAPTALGDVSLLSRARLPAAAAGLPGRTLPLSPTEALLAASPTVRLERRAYGSSRAARITSAGFRELHPPEVCLSAAGYEVVARGQEHHAHGCVGHLTLHHRRDGALAHLYFTYTDGATVTCSFWRRAGLAAWGLLSGHPVAWSALEVMDSDPGRARSVLLSLLEPPPPHNQSPPPRRTP